jgi:hypothetical protein
MTKNARRTRKKVRNLADEIVIESCFIKMGCSQMTRPPETQTTALVGKNVSTQLRKVTARPRIASLRGLLHSGMGISGADCLP